MRGSGGEGRRRLRFGDLPSLGILCGGMAAPAFTS